MNPDHDQNAAEEQADLEQLVTGLRTVLTGQEWPDLVASLPDPSDDTPVRIAFVGPYNAGKSTLIAALTGDLSIRRSGKPESAEPTRHPWRDGVELVDVPGWFSGFADHDDRAEDDLRRHADLVALVMTVELGDELIVEALEHVLGTLHFSERAIVVINKVQTEDSDLEIIREEVKRRLGRFADTPIVSTDAQSLIDTISGEFALDTEAIEILAAGSGVPALTDRLNDLAMQHRATARLTAQTMQSVRVTTEAVERLTPSPEEIALTASLDDYEQTLSRARDRVSALAASHFSQLESGIAAIADVVLDVDGISEREHSEAWSNARRAVESLSTAAGQVLDELAIDLDVVISSLGFTTDGTFPSAVPKGARRDARAKSLPARLRRAMGVDITRASEVIGGIGEKVSRDGSRQGSIAYEWARKIQPRKKFAPYERLSDAKKIHLGGRIASKAPIAIPAIEEAWRWWQEERATRQEAKTEDHIRKQYARNAREESERVRAEFDEWFAERLEPFVRKLALGRGPLEEVAAEREATRDELTSLRQALLRKVAPELR